MTCVWCFKDTLFFLLFYKYFEKQRTPNSTQKRTWQLYIIIIRSYVYIGNKLPRTKRMVVLRIKWSGEYSFDASGHNVIQLNGNVWRLHEITAASSYTFRSMQRTFLGINLNLKAYIQMKCITIERRINL